MFRFRDVETPCTFWMLWVKADNFVSKNWLSDNQKVTRFVQSKNLSAPEQDILSWKCDFYCFNLTGVDNFSLLHLRFPRFLVGVVRCVEEEKESYIGSVCQTWLADFSSKKKMDSERYSGWLQPFQEMRVLYLTSADLSPLASEFMRK